MINSPSQGNEGLIDNFGKMARRISIVLLLSGAAAPFSVAQAAPQETQATVSPEAIKKAEALLGQTFTCYANGGKSPEQAAMAQFAKETGLSVAEVEANFVPEIVSQPEGPFRKMVARMARKATPKVVEAPAAAVDELSKPFPCFANAGKSPEQAAREQFAKDNSLPIKEVESGYSVEIVSQPEGPFRKMVARMVVKKAVEKPIIEETKPIPETIKKPERLIPKSPMEKAMAMVGRYFKAPCKKNPSTSEARNIAYKKFASKTGLELETVGKKFGIANVTYYVEQGVIEFTAQSKNDPDENDGISRSGVQISAGIGDLGTSGGAGERGQFQNRNAAAAPSTAVNQEAQAPKGKLDKSAVKDIQAKIRKAIMPCFDRELKKNPMLKGYVYVLFTVGTNGQVNNVEITKDTLKNDIVTQRLKELLLSYKLDPIDEEEDAGLPFVFARVD